MILSLIAIVIVVFGLMLYAVSGVKLDFSYVILGDNVCDEEGARSDRNACSHAVSGMSIYFDDGWLVIW